MDKNMLERILETIYFYYRNNLDVLPDDDIVDLKEQIKYIEDMISKQETK